MNREEGIRQVCPGMRSHLKNEWGFLTYALRSSFLVTVFGYGAPETDVEAVRLMTEAWGNPEQRNLEQFEIIDIQAQEVVYDRWSSLIHSDHYDCSTDYFESALAYFPRRTGESSLRQFLPSTEDEAFQEPNPVPRDFSTLDQMWDWFRPLIEAEEKASQDATLRTAPIGPEAIEGI